MELTKAMAKVLKMAKEWNEAPRTTQASSLCGGDGVIYCFEDRFVRNLRDAIDIVPHEQWAKLMGRKEIA